MSYINIFTMDRETQYKREKPKIAKGTYRKKSQDKHWDYLSEKCSSSLGIIDLYKLDDIQKLLHNKANNRVRDSLQNERNEMLAKHLIALIIRIYK